MHRDSNENSYKPTKVIAISFFFIFLLFAWQGNKGFSLYDEGYLWYGVQRVISGDIPILDFMAYDPGRYYWSASLLSIFDNYGIMGLRASIAIFQLLGLIVGILLIDQSSINDTNSRDRYIFIIMSAATITVWMYPRHKLFDISLSIFLIGILAFIVRNPTLKRYFLTGVCVGAIAVFGRNHGIYGMIASLGVILWLSIKNNSGPKFINGVFFWGLGIVVGFLPIIFMVFLIPDFGIAFWESILFLFEQRKTNLPLPVPWPWSIKFSILSAHEVLHGIFIGLFFVGLIVFGVGAIPWVVRKRLIEKPVPPALVATTFLSFPYAHYAFSRADVGHLAQGIFPLLIGILVILSNTRAKVKWPLTTILCATSFFVMLEFHPGWQCLKSKKCVDIEVSGSNLLVDPSTANDIALLRQLTDSYAPNGQTFIATPFWPGAYALMERQSPMWEVYALFPRQESFENKEIERIKASKPGFAFVFDFPLDGRDDLRFKNTHPLIYKYILDNFYQVQKNLNPDYQIFIPKVQKKGRQS